MLNASFTWQHQAIHFGDQGYMSQTKIWALEGKVYGPFGANNPRTQPNYYTRWLLKVGGIYQLPHDINVTYAFQARDGYQIWERLRVTDYTIPNPRARTQWPYLNQFGDDRLELFYRLDLGIEKVLRSGDFGRVYIRADVFNVFNSKIENRRYMKDWGTFYFYGPEDSRNRFVDWGDAYQLFEVLDPRVFRLGVRFQF